MGSVQILALFSVLLISAVDSTPRTYYMDRYCGSTIYVSQSSALLELTANSEYSPDTDCVVTVHMAKYILFNHKMMVKFLSLDMESSSRCADDSLKIYDGSSTYSEQLTAPNGLCGHTAPSAVYRTSFSHVTFKFKSDGSVEGKGFKTLITAFGDSGFCRQFKCNNLDCIDKSLKCDGYYNCDDDSDETSCNNLSVGGIVGIAIGCIVAVIILVVVVVGLASKSSNRSRTGCRQAQGPSTNCNQPYTVFGSPGQNPAGKYPVGQYPPQNTSPPPYGNFNAHP